MISNRTQLELVKELPQARIRMLSQMAGAMESEAAELSSRTQCLEEEESLVSAELSGHQTELNRLSARLEALRLERDTLLERIETLRAEAAAIREEASSNEDEVVIESLKSPTVLTVVSSGSRARRVMENPGRRWRDRQ
jgi:chromosome segregation ATPase